MKGKAFCCYGNAGLPFKFLEDQTLLSRLTQAAEAIRSAGLK